MKQGNQAGTIDRLDRSIIEATQAGLPLCAEPYAAVADRLGLSEALVLERLRGLQARGVIRRIGAVPNHYALGYRANGMSVWDLPDDCASRLGAQVGALDFVSHCYLRPRHPPLWPYNLFAMVHGKSRSEVAEKVARIADLLGDHCRGHDLLYSSRILKKTGLRLQPERKA